MSPKIMQKLQIAAIVKQFRGLGVVGAIHIAAWKTTDIMGPPAKSNISGPWSHVNFILQGVKVTQSISRNPIVCAGLLFLRISKINRAFIFLALGSERRDS